MSGTPRLRSAYPSSPGSTPRKNEQHAKTPGPQSPRPPLPPAAPSQENASPMIPFTLIDAPSQRLYVLMFYAALNTWRLSDFFGLMNEEQESLWLFMKWLLIDSIFLYGLPEFQIPWLQWSSSTTAMLVILHTILNAFLMFRIPVRPARNPEIWKQILNKHADSDRSMACGIHEDRLRQRTCYLGEKC